MFQFALDKYQRDILSLKRRREYLKDGRFLVDHIFSGEAGESWETYYRGDGDYADWEDWCRQHDKDPSLDSFTVPADYVASGGVSYIPPEPLPRLIAMYILSGLNVEALLRVLHHEAETTDREQLELHVSGKTYSSRETGGRRPGLKGEARTIARLIRGGVVEKSGGRKAEGLNLVEEQAARYIQLNRRRGVSDDKTLQELREGCRFEQWKPFDDGNRAAPVSPWPDMLMEELERLGNFNLNPAHESSEDAMHI